MKAVIINGSPNGSKGNTGLILNPFCEGMEAAGAEVRTFLVKDMDVKPCLGEYYCWTKSPGQCFQDDDVETLIPEVLKADVLVLATPLYVDGMTGTLKMVMDRMIPAVHPLIELRHDHCRHSRRNSVPQAKLVLVSNCGFWELDNFDALVHHAKAVSANFDMTFAGALLRPHGHAFKAMLAHNAPVTDIVEAAKTAGQQLVQTGQIDETLLNTISRPLLPRDEFIAIANNLWSR